MEVTVLCGIGIVRVARLSRLWRLVVVGEPCGIGALVVR
jgi:hypothetical protein